MVVAAFVVAAETVPQMTVSYSQNEQEQSVVAVNWTVTKLLTDMD